QTHMKTPAGAGNWVPSSIALPNSQTITIGPTTNPNVIGSLVGSFTFPVIVGGTVTTSVWTLSYSVDTTYRTQCSDLPQYTTPNLLELTAIQLPAGIGGYSFAYSGCAGSSGLLTRLTLPTGATVDYEYGTYTFFHPRYGANQPGCGFPSIPT